jgi:predicted Zn-dependent protease
MSSPSVLPAPGPRPRRWRKPLVVLGVIAALAGAAAVWWFVPSTWERAEGLRAARAGEFDRAERLLVRALEKAPDDPEVVEALARGYAAADDPRAESHLSRWVALRPGQPEPLRQRMEFYRKRKQRGEAFADGRRLLDLAPDDHQLRRSVLHLAFSAGRFEEAEGLCRDCLRVQPADTGLRVLLAEILRARGDLAAAAAELDRLLRQHPKLVPAMLARAVVHLEAGEPEPAVPLLREVMAADPRRRAAAGYQLCLALDRIGRPEETHQVLAEVRRLQDADTFAEAIRVQPDNLELRVRLAESLLADGHTADGLKLLAEVLARDPHFRPAHRALAAHYEKNGQPAKAAEHRRLAGPDP